MNNSCVIHPRLSNGEKSPLFTRLKNFLGNTEEANSIYYRVITPEFKSKFPTVRFDDNNEPLFEDLITKCGIGYNKTIEDTLKSLNREYGTSPVPMTMTSSIELQNKAGEFNTNTSLDATAVVNSTDGKIKIDIIKKDKNTNNRLLGRQQRFNAELNSQLIKLLNSWGADVGTLTQLEEDNNINGVMDLNAALNAATGLKEVIRISKRHRWSSVSKKENVLSEKEQAILKNAPRDSQGRLLAPNGKLSNLTEKQYAQVRTKAFKRWFGDWENNLENASKVVDENGEPLIVYHGSKDNSFTIFDSTKNDKGQKGFFFTNDSTMASSYGKNPRGFFINSRNPYVIEGHNKNWNDLTVEVTDIAKDKLDSIRLFRNDLLLQLKEGKTSKEIYDYWNDKYFKLYDKYLSLSNSFIDKIKKIAILNRLNKFEGKGNFLKSTRYTERVLELDSEDTSIIFKSIKDYGPVFDKEAAVNMINNVAANVYVVTNSNNIKSATDNSGAFSDTENDITDDTYNSNILAEEWGHFVVEAVTDNPLRDRMLKTLKNDEVLQRLLGDDYYKYQKIYNGDIDLLAREALGKMMAQVLNSYDPAAPNDRLFERYKNSILNFFGNKNPDEIDEIINQVRAQVYEFTTNAFAGKYNLNIRTPEYNRTLYNLGEQVSKEHKILERMIKQEEKRLAIYGRGAKATIKEKKESSVDFDDAQKLFIDTLKQDLEDHKELEGIYRYVDKAVTMLKQLSNRLDTIDTFTGSDSSKFSILKNIRDYMASYGSILEELRQEISIAKKEGDTTLRDKLQDSLYEFSGLVAQLGNDWTEITKDEFANYVKEFEGEGISMSIRGKRKQYTIRELLDYTEQDITIVERWIDSMADSTDPILRIYDAIVKRQKNKARLTTIDMEKELLMRAKKLEEAGINNTDFMYERRTKDGRLSGNFVTKYNWSDYYTDLSSYVKSLDPNLSKQDKARLISQWKNEHMNGNNPVDDYINPVYIEIQNNPAKKAYYDYIMDLKKSLDYSLPARYVRISKAPQIRRDFLERVLGKSNKLGYLWESIKDDLVRREDDDEFSYGRQDFEGNQIFTLPIYYTKNLRDKNDLSTDCTSSMIAYMAMANDYIAMNEVIDALEVGKLLLAKRKVARTKGGRILKELINKESEDLTMEGSESKAFARLNDFMEMQVYGNQMKDEGTVAGIDVGKAANMLNKIQSYGTTALSVLTGTANLAQNILNSNLESIAERFFSKRDLANADLAYSQMLPEYLGEIGNRIQISKMALFAEKFNVLQDYKQSIRDIDWNRKTWLSRLFKENTLWFTTSAGDHYTQMRTALALAHSWKVSDSEGNIVPLFEALKVEYLDDSHPEYGAKLVLPEGYLDSNGNPITEEYFIKFTKVVRGINDKLYGIYNQEDKSAMQLRAIGRLLIMYRNWMRPLYLKRYGVEKYNEDIGTFEEGYYRTLYHYISNIIKDLKKGELTIFQQWGMLTNEQKGSIWQAISELSTFGILLGIISSLKSTPDDKGKNNWLADYISYAIIRLKADMGALVPGPAMLDEGLRLFDNPFAAIGVLKNTRQLFNLLNPDTWTTEIDQGIYKGYTKAEKIMLKPLPFVRQFQNLFDPEEPARWYR